MGWVDDDLEEQASLLLVCELKKMQTDADEVYAWQVQAEEEDEVRVQAEEGAWDWVWQRAWQWVGSKIHLGW
jgi:hypothetical protein